MKRDPRSGRAPFDREQAMRRYRARRASREGLRPEAFPILAVPASTLPLAPLPAKRRRLYVSHLRRLLRALTTGEELPPPAHQLPPAALVTAAQERVLEAGCRACRGRCCETGGAHAYQTLDDVRRVRAARPALGARGIIALYLSHLPVRTVRGSCVFHGRRGCGLPRDLRGAMCNRYLCPPLREWREQAEASGETAAFVLSYDDGLLRGGELMAGCSTPPSMPAGRPSRPASSPACGPSTTTTTTATKTTTGTTTGATAPGTTGVRTGASAGGGPARDPLGA